MILLDNIEEKISKLIRLKDFKDGKNIKKENCLLILQEKNVWQYTVYDDENLGFGFYSYNVTINWLDKFNFKCSCNCRNYKKYNSCLHIGAILWHYQDSLFKDNELEVSDLFLKKYSCLSPDIKQEIKLELYFEFSENNIKYWLKIGINQFYLINDNNKLKKFKEAYYFNKIFELSNTFFYSNSKYYFNDQTKELLNYLFLNDDLFLSKQEFLGLTRYLTNIKFYIINYGYINNIFYTIPTKFNLTYNYNYYYLTLEDYNNYLFVNNTDFLIIYKNDLYIVPNEYINIINDFRNTLLNKISFSNFNIFKNGLYNSIYKLLNIDKECNKKINNKPVVLIYLDIKNNNILCKLEFKYNEIKYPYFNKENLIERDYLFENIIIKELYSYGFLSVNNNLILKDNDKIGTFLEYYLPKLVKVYEVYISQKLNKIKVIKDVNISSSFKLNNNNLISYNFNVNNLDILEINKIIENLKLHKKYYRLKNGDLINLLNNKNLNNFNELLDDLKIKKLSSNNISFPLTKAFYLNSLKNKKYDFLNYDSSFNEFLNNFNEYKNVNLQFNNVDNKQLRNYQKLGVKWLYILYKTHLGGILADEMGLGKTYEAICFIKEVLKDNKNSKILIITPTSLIYNWEKELVKFSPNIKYLIIYDNKIKRKKLYDFYNDYNIFITSYGLIRNDNDYYLNKKFDICLIDEAQNIKNYYTLLSNKIKNIKAHTKIALTGTPIENSILDLWNIFDFILPGYLGNLDDFMMKYHNFKNLEELKVLIGPFILRRTKKDVIKDLPSKIEKNIYLELTDTAKALYLKNLSLTKKELNNSSSKIKILALLMKLRQICIDPHLIYDNYPEESVKMLKLLEIVRYYVKNNHKILIFSSFKSVIDNVELLFKENNITSYKITGSVKSNERNELVNNFNKNNINCFLITLKAGGVGLNLTSADIVIHLDIWWNPQVEIQATDRAHRIGQTKTVTVLKLITRGTIEENILKLQEQKSILSNELITTNNNNLFNLSKEDIKTLLSTNF